MSEHDQHRKREIVRHSTHLSHDDIIAAHAIRLAAEAAANQTLDGSEPVRFVPHPNPEQVLDFGTPVVSKKKIDAPKDSDRKVRSLQKSLIRLKLRVE